MEKSNICQAFCKKCGNEFLFIESRNGKFGLYCAECGSWQKWLKDGDSEFYCYFTKEKS